MFEVVFHVDPHVDLDEAWRLLESSGCQLLYSTEDDDEAQIIGKLPLHLNVERLLTLYSFLKNVEQKPLPPIDWNAQWAAHGMGYADGLLHINLADFAADQRGGIVKLQPGPGFGDLSHPTTRLVLRLANKRVAGQHVIDVGCGSGILSFAAAAWGAASVTGIDIDRDAIEHAKENGLLIEQSPKVAFMTPEECISQALPGNPLVILMNMIQSEQVVAWESLKPIHPHVHWAITSGVMVEEKESYFKLCANRGWRLIETMEEDGWIGCVWEKNKFTS